MKYYNYPDPRGTEIAENVDSKNISDFAPGGGGGIAIINLVGIEEKEDKLVTTFDKTFNEIYELVTSKTLVFLYSDKMYDAFNGGLQDMPPAMQCVLQVDPSDFSVYLTYDSNIAGTIEHSYRFDGQFSNTVTIDNK